MLILACTLCIGTAGAQDSDGAVGDEFDDDTLKYKIVSETPNEVSVIGHLVDSASITIPDTVDHDGQTYTIISIGEKAFYSRMHLKSIAFNTTSLSSIGNSAFCDSYVLEEIQIPDTVTSIGERAFSHTSMKSVTIPSGVTQINNKTFKDCSELSSVTFQGQVASIGEMAFYYCESLTTIQIPDSVTSIGKDAFGYCNSLQSIRFGKEISDIAADAFYTGDIWGTTVLTIFYDETGMTAFDLTTQVGELQGRLFKTDGTDKSKMIRQPLYTLTFDCGDGVTKEVKYIEGDRIAKPDDPQRTGYSFMYWAKDGKEFDFANAVMPAEDMTLTAVWKADAFTVKFVTGTGTEIAEKHVYGEAITLPGEGGEISKTGYTLSGWQISGQGDAYKPGTEYVVTSDVTFTAVWEAVPSPTPTPAPAWDDDDDPYYPPSPSGDSGQTGKRTDSSEDILIVVACVAAFMAVLTAYVCSAKR